MSAAPQYGMANRRGGGWGRSPSYELHTVEAEMYAHIISKTRTNVRDSIVSRCVRQYDLTAYFNLALFELGSVFEKPGSGEISSVQD